MVLIENWAVLKSSRVIDSFTLISEPCHLSKIIGAEKKAKMDSRDLETRDNQPRCGGELRLDWV